MTEATRSRSTAATLAICDVPDQPREPTKGRVMSACARKQTSRSSLWRVRAVALLGVAVVAFVEVQPQPGWAACNIIPSATTTFRGALGSTDRPFAGPGDLIEMRVRPDICDGESVGFSSLPSDEVVTLIFTPPNGGPENVLVLASDCTGIGGCSITKCYDADKPGAPKLLEIVERNGERRLLVRFPDTDDLLDGINDDRTFSGPVTIAVKDRRFLTSPTQYAACELLSQPCTAVIPEAGLVACVDDLFTLDGTCRTDAPRLDRTFGHFTALPPPNDYQAICTTPMSSCLGTAAELHLTTDADGNVLIPMDWQGVLVRDGVTPVPRILRTESSLEGFAGLSLVKIPGADFLRSYTPEGALLPPIFVPQNDPSVPSEVAFFGSADAPRTVLRVARRSATFQRCAGGDNAGLPCADPHDCPNGTCGSTVCCSAGTNSCGGTACSGDADCAAGQECGPSLFQARDRYDAGVGPIVLPRTVAMCTAPPNQVCAVDANDPVPLEGLASSEDVFAFSQREAITGRDLDGDGDQTDTAMTLTDRSTGASLPMGPGGALGRAVTTVQQPPFAFPAVATENAVAAFLEPEPLQGDCTTPQNCDKNRDFDIFDTILRAYKVTGGSAVYLGFGGDLYQPDGRPMAGGGGPL